MLLPAPALAGETPDWQIGFEWNGIEISEGDKVPAALNQRKSSLYTWPGGSSWGYLYEGALHNAVENNGHSIRFSPNFEVDQFKSYGPHFVIIAEKQGDFFKDAGFREWFKTGTTTLSDDFFPNHWGILNFEVVDPNAKTGNSSVAFIPGLQASRLYIQESDVFENRVWEPGSDTDGEKLFMTPTGVSQRDVYTKDIIDEGAGVVNVYKSFIKDLDGLVDEGEIAEWRALPYDWRHNVFDVASGDIKLPDGETYRMVEEIEGLAQNSDSGKVTIITHSNGGLVAKALISELESQDKAELVDKLILVAVPQLGTPKAIASILHGDYQEKGFGKLLTAETARLLGKNMPGGYGLLPSAEYFDKISDPVIVFDDESSAFPLCVAYGTCEVTDAATLDDFMLAEEGDRVQPDREDLLTPIIANEALLSQARDGQAILDNWTPPEGVEVVEIVGWGRDTLKGVKYQDKEVVLCINSECEVDVVMDHIPLLTKDGDKTVVSPSANLLDSATSYFLNIRQSNAGPRTNRQHASILEVDSVLSLLDSILKNEEIASLPQFITEKKPSTSEAGDSLRLSAHSPVSIGVIDDSGNFTGLVDDYDLIEISEEISNSFYLPFGDGKYVGVPVGEDYEVELVGQDIGIFTFNIEHLSGDDVEDVESFINVPVNTETIATLSIDANGDAGELELDVNGDGESDVALSPGDEFSSTDYIAVLREMIENSNLEQDTKDSLLDRLDNIEKNLEKDKSNGSVDALLHSMIHTLQNESADNIVKIINILREVI